jgi:hypothetical protein
VTDLHAGSRQVVPSQRDRWAAISAGVKKCEHNREP